MDVSEAAKFLHTKEQIVSKLFNLIVKVHVLPEISLRQWHMKPLQDKKWATFKSHSSKESRDFKKDQDIAVRNT